MSYRGKSVLITGGLGFIGSNLARRLVSIGARVTLVDSLLPNYGGNLFNIHDVRDSLRAHIRDIRDADAMAHLARDQHYLFNLAGQTSHLDSMSDPLTDLGINVSAQLSILETCRAINPGIKIVFTSTRQIYGKPRLLPVDETHPIRPVDINGIHKAAGEAYHLLYNNVFGIRTVALRLTNTYGPRMRVSDARQTFLGIWIRKLLNGEPIQIFGDGTQLRDFTYVDDCVDALLLAGLDDSVNGEALNLGGAEVFSLNELAALLLDLVPGASSELVEFPPDRAPIDIGDYHADFKMIERRLGWSPRVRLADGLRRTLDYYRAHGSEYWTPET